MQNFDDTFETHKEYRVLDSLTNLFLKTVVVILSLLKIDLMIVTT